jgi:DNA-3-methyladenine glycosylase I
MPRCPWAVSDLSVRYHDAEWGVPVHDDRALFELLVLEGAQAGLSWETILRKRARYREVFSGFDPRAVARFTPARVSALLADPGIVRNRLKVESAVTNARALLRVQKEFGSFAAHLWGFVGGTPIDARRRRMQDIPARTPLSDAISRDLRARGFRFVGSTICYALIQAAGLVNDHLVSCPMHAQVSRRARALSASAAPGGRARAPRKPPPPAPRSPAASPPPLPPAAAPPPAPPRPRRTATTRARAR